MAPHRWDPESEYKLMAAAIVTVDAKLPTQFFEDFAASLDKDITSSAVYQRFYKLKKEAETILSKTGTSTGNAVAGPSTPANKPTSAGTKKSTGKGRKRKTDADDEDDAVEASPTKSTKAKKTKSAKTVDAEEDAEVEAGDAGDAEEA